uniref:Uncharacterized protein n=1 Tax=Rhizophora mucronata TaxID=61149 RepID=A0A2P2L618_RHIMU
MFLLCSETLCQSSQIQQLKPEVKLAATHPALAHKEWHPRHGLTNSLLYRQPQHFHCARQRLQTQRMLMLHSQVPADNPF